VPFQIEMLLLGSMILIDSIDLCRSWMKEPVEPAQEPAQEPESK
jgi:hypothetical protein